jgi:SET and MYND domain-containing protein
MNATPKTINSNMEEAFPWEEFMLARKFYIRSCLDSEVEFKSLHSIKDVKIPEDIKSLVETSPKHNWQPIYSTETALAMVIASSFPLLPEGAVEFFESLLHKFKCNNFGILDSIQFVIGHGVYPRGAVLNHSCDPNCILTYQGSRQVIRTILPVKEGQELYHSYTDICEPTFVRKQHLKTTYGFECKCSRCRGIGKWKEVEKALVEDLGMKIEDELYVRQSIDEAQQSSIEVTAADNQTGTVNNNGFYEDNEEQLKREYNSLGRALDVQREKLGKYNLERYKTECLALSTSLMLGVEAAVIHAEHVVNFLRFVCHPYHPLLLVQQMSLVELQYLHGRGLEALEGCRQLIESCKITFGVNHEFVHRYQEFLLKLKREQY